MIVHALQAMVGLFHLVGIHAAQQEAHRRGLQRTVKGEHGHTGHVAQVAVDDNQPVKRGDEYTVEFSQKMTLQGGEYLLSMSCTGFEHGEHVVYHRLYNVTNITVISNKNTVGVYDMESQVKAEKKSCGGGCS